MSGSDADRGVRPHSSTDGGTDGETDAGPDEGPDPIPFADSPLLTYVIPFAGSLLIAVGIGAGVVGAYAPVQQELGLCGAPTIGVSTPAETAALTDGSDGPAPSLDRLDVDDLTPAERRAFEAALADPFGEGHVRGDFRHREAFERGVLIRSRNETRYATLTSDNQCASTSPLLFPLGVAAILLGVVWILAPPMYRKLATLERPSHRG